MKIGIFGGCFNPPHKMHESVALNLINKGYLDKVIYVPTGDKYNKSDLVLHKYRLEMLKLMIKSNDNLLVSDIGANNDLQYTYQQLDYFKNLYKNDEIYFICGSDNLNEFDIWMRYDYILNNYKLLVIKRNKDDMKKILNKYNDYIDNIICADIESEKISSTMIRDMLKNKKSTLKYLKKDIKDYIDKNSLYGDNYEKINKKI